MASLVYHTGALGDFITTLPAIQQWKKAHDGARLVLLGRPGHGALAPRLFDETWDAAGARFAPLFAEDPAGSAALELLRGIRSALVFASASSPLWAAVSRLGLADTVRQDPFPPPGLDTHVVDYHLELFGDQVRSADRVPRIPVGDRSRSARVVALHHGSGSIRKNWPRHRFEECAAAMSAHGYSVAWISGPAEDGSAPAGVTEEWRSLSLLELARHLAGSRLYIGNDSGVSHLAAAVGIPTVALFGAANHLVWAPRGPHVRIIRSGPGSIDDIATEDVLAVAWDLLGDGR